MEARTKQRAEKAISAAVMPCASAIRYFPSSSILSTFFITFLMHFLAASYSSGFILSSLLHHGQDNRMKYPRNLPLPPRAHLFNKQRQQTALSHHVVINNHPHRRSQSSRRVNYYFVFALYNTLTCSKNIFHTLRCLQSGRATRFRPWKPGSRARCRWSQQRPLWTK